MIEMVEIPNKLQQNGDVFKGLFNAVSEEQVSWKPNDKKWSMLEIACHLFDEEKEDFRQRIDFTLNKNGKPWPSIDPQGWVKSRKYADQDFEDTVNRFLRERVRSVKWLKKRKNPNWENRYVHPSAGELSAYQLLVNWLAHDLLHIRQITTMHYLYLSEKSAPLKLDYAGNW